MRLRGNSGVGTLTRRWGRGPRGDQVEPVIFGAWFFKENISLKIEFAVILAVRRKPEFPASKSLFETLCRMRCGGFSLFQTDQDQSVAVGAIHNAPGAPHALAGPFHQTQAIRRLQRPDDGSRATSGAGGNAFMGRKETAVALEAGEGLKDEMCPSGDLTGLGQGPDLGSERGHVRPFQTASTSQEGER